MCCNVARNLSRLGRVDAIHSGTVVSRQVPVEHPVWAVWADGLGHWGIEAEIQVPHPDLPVASKVRDRVDPLVDREVFLH